MLAIGVDNGSRRTVLAACVEALAFKMDSCRGNFDAAACGMTLFAVGGGGENVSTLALALTTLGAAAAAAAACPSALAANSSRNFRAAGCVSYAYAPPPPFITNRIVSISVCVTPHRAPPSSTLFTIALAVASVIFPDRLAPASAVANAASSYLRDSTILYCRTLYPRASFNTDSCNGNFAALACGTVRSFPTGGFFAFGVAFGFVAPAFVFALVFFFAPALALFPVVALVVFVVVVVVFVVVVAIARARPIVVVVVAFKCIIDAASPTARDAARASAPLLPPTITIARDRSVDRRRRARDVRAPRARLALASLVDDRPHSSCSRRRRRRPRARPSPPRVSRRP